MKLYLQSACQLAFLSLCCVLITVRESASGTFVPGRCMCPETQNGVRGPLKDLKVVPRGPSCDRDTVIVTLKKNSELVCLNPEAPFGKQLMRCWRRATTKGRDVKLCLKRRRGQKSRQRNGGHSRRVKSSISS
ncbi:C-X-C motif chemokine 10-like [Diretmus argenteus]